jgi:hypothetical protein
LIARAVPNAAENLAFRGAALVEVGRCQVRGGGNQRTFGLPVFAVATGAVLQERRAPLVDGFFRVSDRALQLGRFLVSQLSRRVS